MIDILGLKGSPVGVRLLRDSDVPLEGVERLQQHRYCQALMRARHGRHVLLDGAQLACPAAAAAFGFRPLTEALRSGKGLVGIGIVSDPAVGRAMFEAMPRLDPILKNTGLVDTVGGSAVFYQSQVKLIRVPA